MGKGGKASETSSTETKEVLIDGQLYDVTDFMNRHPGGTVIKFYTNEKNDASQAFHQFHVRSERAYKMLKNMKSRPATNTKEYNPLPNQEELLKDFNDLTKKFEEMGYFKPDLLHVFTRTTEILLMHVIGLYLVFSTKSWDMVRILGLFILGLATGRCGWFMHEGGHYSLTGNIAADRVIQIIFYGVGCGMSGAWWRSQHNRHHSMPQKLGFDVDLDTLPLVAFTQKSFGLLKRKAGSFQKLWIKLQALLFPTVTTFLVAVGWQLYLHPRLIMRKREYLEGLSLFARYFAIYHYFVPVFGLKETLLMYCLYNWIGANYIFINFAVSHTHLPVVAKEDNTVDWVRYAANHTMNVKSGAFRWVDWWMSFLNFQIEHHLFPCMPQVRTGDILLKIIYHIGLSF